jgi:RND family efflux transporter MFP subunit
MDSKRVIPAFRLHCGCISRLLLFCFAVGAADVKAADPVPVKAVAFAEIAIDDTVSVPATVVARNRPGIAAEIDARIAAIPVLVGDRVRRGELLARLDCRRAEATLGSARADLDRALATETFTRLQLERARDLQRKQSISEEIFDQRRTDLSAARAGVAASRQQLALAQIDVENCDLFAPVDGIVNGRESSVGSFVNRGTVIITLTETQGVEVSAQLRQEQAASLAGGVSPVFRRADRDYATRLRAIVDETDPVTRTREARLVFTEDAALPGSAGRLVWKTGNRLLPADLVVRRDGRLGAFVLDGGQARFMPLTGAQQGRPVAVTLPPRTLLITDGRQALSNGQAVTLVSSGD